MLVTPHKKLRFILVLCLVLYIIVYFYKWRYYYHFKEFQHDMDKILCMYTSRLHIPIDLYYINVTNCEKSRAREQRLLDRLSRFKYIVPHRVDAITPSTLPKMILTNRCIFETKLVNACAVSHLKAIHTAYHNANEIAIIAEDDIIILRDINWYYLASLAPLDWDVLQLHTIAVMGSTVSFNRIYQYKDTNILWLQTDHKISSAAFYIINRRGMQKILEAYVPNYEDPNWDHIDVIDLRKEKNGCAADMIVYDQVRRYICTHPFVNVESLDSTLHEDHVDKYHRNTTEYINKIINK